MPASYCWTTRRAGAHGGRLAAPDGTSGCIRRRGRPRGGARFRHRFGADSGTLQPLCPASTCRGWSRCSMPATRRWWWTSRAASISATAISPARCGASAPGWTRWPLLVSAARHVVADVAGRHACAAGCRRSPRPDEGRGAGAGGWHRRLAHLRPAAGSKIAPIRRTTPASTSTFGRTTATRGSRTR